MKAKEEEFEKLMTKQMEETKEVMLDSNISASEKRKRAKLAPGTRRKWRRLKRRKKTRRDWTKRASRKIRKAAIVLWSFESVRDGE